MNERLAKLARQRYDGAWELLATVAGNSDAIRRCCEMLSSPVLDDFVHPDWMIEERVEALAAYDSALLASLASEWPLPTKSASPFVHTAWRVGLRHLLPILSLKREDFDVCELSEETAVLWPQDTSEPITWDQAFQLVRMQPIFNYTLVRQLARRPLMGSLPSLDELRAYPAWLLPLLRGQIHRLESAARNYLVESGRLCLASDLRPGTYVAQTINVDKATGALVIAAPIQYLPLGKVDLLGNASIAPPIIELCREIDGDLVEELGHMLADQIERLLNPKLAAPLAYLLLTQWTLP